MIPAYQSTLSALQAFGTKIQSHANNIANANTDGFKKTRVMMSETQPRGVKATVDQVNIPGPTIFQESATGLDPVELANVDLGTEIPELNLTSQLYKANLKTIETTEEMTGALLKIIS